MLLTCGKVVRMNVNRVLDKIKFIKHFQTDLDLASELGISHVTLSSWRRRGSIDASLIIEKFPDLDLNYIFSDTDELPDSEDKIAGYNREGTIKMVLEKLESIEAYLRSNGSSLTEPNNK
jgi:hypothetical protein